MVDLAAEDLAVAEVEAGLVEVKVEVGVAKAAEGLEAGLGEAEAGLAGVEAGLAGVEVKVGVAKAAEGLGAVGEEEEMGEVAEDCIQATQANRINYVQ